MKMLNLHMIQPDNLDKYDVRNDNVHRMLDNKLSNSDTRQNIKISKKSYAGTLKGKDIGK